MITCGKGLLAQINENYYYDRTISKEELLVWAKELDEQFEKEYPYCTEQNLITRILKECFSMDKIKLRNRYNEDNYLERIEGDKWKLCLGNSDDDSYTRVGLLEGKTWEDKDYSFVDPPGGPFISVGSEISGMVVYKITAEEPGYIIYLKEEEKKEDEEMGSKRIVEETKAVLELAANGYILHFDDPNIILVYEGEDIPEEMYRELCSEVEEAVAGGKTNKISITVTVECTT